MSSAIKVLYQGCEFCTEMSVAEKHGIICSLLPGNSIADVKGLDLKLFECLELIGARILLPGNDLNALP